MSSLLLVKKLLIKKRLLKLMVIGIFIIFLENICNALEFQNGVWQIKLVRIIDEKLPSINDVQLNKILNETKKLIAHKFLQKVEFQILETVPIHTFFEKYKNDPMFLKLSKALPQKNGVFNMDPAQIDKESTINHLKLRRVELFHIKDFLPEYSIHIKSYEDAFKIILSKYMETKKVLMEIRDDPGTPYFKSNNEIYWSLANWKAILSVKAVTQNFDLILTNVPIVLDLKDISNIHGTVARGVVCGAVGGTYLDAVAVVSTFPFYVTHPFFENFRGDLTTEEKLFVIGEIIAHELGHSIFKLSDDYSPENGGCLMQRSRETLNDKKRFYLVKKRSACEKEIIMARLLEAKEWWKKNNKAIVYEIVKEVEHADIKSYRVLIELSIVYSMMDEIEKVEQTYKKMLMLPLPQEQRKIIIKLLKELKKEKANY